MKVNEYSFEELLKEASTLAELSYSKAVFFQKKVDRIFEELSGELNNEFDKLIQQPDAQQFQFKKIVMQIIKDIEIESETHIKQLNISLNLKKNLLDEFTISLFGRTKAGKSTIREALTKGNGKSIGKGSQRTTLDVIPYTWNGLRILDVPGIEAYEGKVDTALARDIIDESDMIIFITSDDAVQPGELTELACIKEWNKPVLFVMNIKSNLLDGESGTIVKRKLDRFLRKPEKIFDVERLLEHKSHLQQYAKKELNLESIKIIEIHAQAAYLSTQEKDSELSKALWEVSKINVLQEQIKEEINRYGKQRRVLTFFDSFLYNTNNLMNVIEEQKETLVVEIKFINEKKETMNRNFSNFYINSKAQISGKIADLYSPLLQWIPRYAEDYLGHTDAQDIYEKYIRKQMKVIENAMKLEMEEISLDLQMQLEDFERQFKFDVEKMTGDEVNVPNIQNKNYGRVFKWGGIGFGGLASVALVAAKIGATNFWNPVGWALFGVSSAAGISSWFISSKEKKKFEAAKAEAKKELQKQIKKMKNETEKIYLSWLTKNFKNDILDRIEIELADFHTHLSNLAEYLDKGVTSLDELQKQVNKHVFFQICSLEGIICKPDDFTKIVRKQGFMTKVIVPEYWNCKGGNQPFLQDIFHEEVHLISDNDNRYSLIVYSLNDILKSSQYSIKIIEDTANIFMTLLPSPDKLPEIQLVESLLEMKINIQEYTLGV